EPTAPAAAPSAVVTSTSEVPPGSAESTEPPLNPNQPSHSRNTPIVAIGMSLPGMGSTLPSLPYLPRRGPRIQAPTRAAPAPTEPQQEHANRAHRHVAAGDGVDLAVLAVLAEARTEHPGADEGRPATHRVHHGGAGEVVEAHGVEEAAAPFPRAGHRVHEGHE